MVWKKEMIRPTRMMVDIYIVHLRIFTDYVVNLLMTDLLV